MITQTQLDAAFDRIYGINRALTQEIIPDLLALGFLFFVVLLFAMAFGGGN